MRKVYQLQAHFRFVRKEIAVLLSTQPGYDCMTTAVAMIPEVSEHRLIFCFLWLKFEQRLNADPIQQLLGQAFTSGKSKSGGQARPLNKSRSAVDLSG